MKKQSNKTKWIIWVGNGYGQFDFKGTEKEAEEMRKHKANWEHAIALKWLKGRKSPISADGTTIDLNILRESNRII